MHLAKNLLHRLLGSFFWKTAHYKGVNEYQENSLTGSRRVIFGFGGYTPIDRAWLEGK